MNISLKDGKEINIGGVPDTVILVMIGIDFS